MRIEYARNVLAMNIIQATRLEFYLFMTIPIKIRVNEIKINSMSNNGKFPKTALFLNSGIWVATFMYSPVNKPIAIQCVLKLTADSVAISR